jgi:hypothetical protein
MRVRSLVIKSVGGGNLINPVIEQSCQTTRNPKIPTMGGKIFWEFLRQNFAKGFGLGRFVFKVVAIM